MSFTLLESALGTESINLSLTIRSLLLELTKSLDFALLLILNTLRLNLSFVLTLILAALVLTDSVILIPLFLLSLILLEESLSVSLSSLLHEEVDAFLLGHSGGLVFLSHLLKIAKELHSLLISDLLILEADLGALLDLINDDLGSLLASLSLANLTLLLFLKDLEALNLHHEVELLLLLKIFMLEALVLLQLLVTNCDDLGVEHHLVHVLHIVEVIVHLLLGAGQESLVLGIFRLLVVAGGLLSGTPGIELLHFSLAGLRLSESSRLLLLKELLLLDHLILGLDSSCVSDAIKVALRDNDGVILVFRLDFASDATQLIKGDDTLRGSNGGASGQVALLSGGISEKGLIDL